MAKLVLAGVADCPYFAKAELLADALVKNLPDFNLHKIVKQPNDWQGWLEKSCSDRGWTHKKSPMVWRELVDRGGKGILIGGANEFQEYAKAYYDVKSVFTSDDMNKVAAENLKTKIEVDKEWEEIRGRSKPIHVCISNASSPVCYGMIEALANGESFGESTELTMRLLDTEDTHDNLGGVEMEATDLASHLLRDTLVTGNAHQAFSECSVIVLLDEIIQQEEESDSDWLKRNYDHFVTYAKIINQVAKKDVKVVLAGNGPINFNAAMMIENAPNVPRQNIVAVSRIVEQHAKSVLAERLTVNSAFVVDIIVWGNTNGVNCVDTSKSRVHQYDGAIWGPPSFSLPASEMVHNDKWLEGEYLQKVQERREAVETALGHRASASLAAAVTSLLNHWWNGSPVGQMFSLGVCSEGWYGVPKGLVCSLPVTFFPAGYWSVIEDINLSDATKEKIQDCIKDLVREREVIYPPPKAPTPEPEPTPDDSNVNNSAQQEEGEGDGLGRISEDTQGEAAAEVQLDTERIGSGHSGSDRPGSAHSVASAKSNSSGRSGSSGKAGSEQGDGSARQSPIEKND